MKVAKAQPPSDIDLGTREANYCLEHFLAAASRYYASACPLAEELLSRANRLCSNEAKRLSAPVRVQPSRVVKKRPAGPPGQTEDESRRRLGVERKIRGLMSAMPIGTDERGAVMGKGRWMGELRARAEGEVARKAAERYMATAGACVFGARTWRCRDCEREGRAAPGAKTRAGTRAGGIRGRKRSMGLAVAPVARIEGEVALVAGIGWGYWWGVDIPEEEIVRFGGLGFVVDVCGHALLMFV
ncbi:uncharacterized protein DNG_10199 [Cephalotrichum gorgonifer]|uniref:Uncharacterized protein n=1 Tax=Cephalotrichum gorgonifer TaxID=2041049 RepID=A0AAE8N758_9PEZI|nr:uncharacterized protein DNG_10199 [Cephalotrichum gorgonifer]